MRGEFAVKAKMFPFHFPAHRNDPGILTSLNKRGLFQGVPIIAGRQVGGPYAKIFEGLAEFRMKIGLVSRIYG
jgi:hypothetical protein